MCQNLFDLFDLQDTLYGLLDIVINIISNVHTLYCDIYFIRHSKSSFNLQNVN